MRDRWRRAAPWGLLIAVGGLMAAFGFAVVEQAWTLRLQISLGTVIIGLAIFALLDPARFRSIISGRQARRGSNVLILTSGVILILAVVNYFGYERGTRWDVTGDNKHTLAPETIAMLKALPEPVTALAFYSGISSSEQAQELLEDFEFFSAGTFSFEFVNPDTDPLIAQQFGVSHEGTIVIQMGEVREQVRYANEREMAGALIRLINPDVRKIYFLTGHGEHDPSGVGDQAYGYARRALVTKNYTVEKLNLLTNQRIPDDTSVLVIAGPNKPISDLEIELLKEYLQNGGALIVMEEPLPMTNFDTDADPLASYLSDTWGIVLGDDLVVDLTSNQPLTAVANQYGSHRITEKMQGLVSFFPDARSVITQETIEGVTQVELVLTATQSWAERDLAAIESDQDIAPDEGIDLLGPISLAAAAENFYTGARLVVFGDADFASDSRFNAYGNGDLFVNSLDWAAETEELISLTPRQMTQRILIPPRQAVFNLIVLLLVFILPGIVVLVGGFVWYQRRRTTIS